MRLAIDIMVKILSLGKVGIISAVLFVRGKFCLAWPSLCSFDSSSYAASGSLCLLSLQGMVLPHNALLVLHSCLMIKVSARDKR